MKNYILSFLILITLFFFVVSVSAITITNPLAAGGVNNFCDLLGKISTGVAGLVGSLSVIMITVSGVMYLVSAGDPQKITSAKKAFQYAIIGIVLSLIAGAIIATIGTMLGAGGINVCT